MTENTGEQLEALEPCPFCGSTEHLSVSPCGSLTRDMPARPHRVVCFHIDHDEVAGPVGYGREAAIAAWNTRQALTPDHVLREALIGPGDPEENAANLGRFGWLSALITDLKDNPEAMAALSAEDPDAHYEAMREVDELIRDVRQALAAAPATSPASTGPAFKDDTRGRVVVSADHPLAKALRPSPEAIERIEKAEREQAVAAHAMRDTLLGSASSPGEQVEYLGGAGLRVLEETADDGEQVERVAREVLSSISSSVGAGLGDENTTADDYEKRILWGIDHLLSGTVRLCADKVEALSKAPAGITWGKVRTEILALAPDIASLSGSGDAASSPGEQIERVKCAVAGVINAETQEDFAHAEDIARAAIASLSGSGDAASSPGEQIERALRFYAEQWDQDIDAEQTAHGWVGSLGEVHPTKELCKDAGALARAAIASLSGSGDADVARLREALKEVVAFCGTARQAIPQPRAALEVARAALDNPGSGQGRGS